MENVLVIYDHSENQFDAYEYALELFKGKNLKLFLFNINDNDSTDKTTNNCDYYRKYTLSTGVDLLYKLGMIIDRKLIDLIVVATKLKKVKDGKFIGKKISEIICGGYNTPIILVPENFKFTALSYITFLTNFERTFISSELKEFIKLALMFNATIDIFNYSGTQELTANQNNNKKNLEAYLEDLEVHFNSSDEIESDLFLVRKHLDEVKSQMVVFVNHKRAFFNKLIEAGGVDFNHFYSKVPLLLLPSINGNLT